MSVPFVSVIIAAKNSAVTLTMCLDSVLTQKACEVIVVDDGSTDATADILAGYSGRIRVISYAQSRGPSRARNDAAGIAQGEFVAFLDSDCIAGTHWLDALRGGFISADVAGCGGVQAVPPGESKFGTLVHRFLRKLNFVSEYARLPGKQVFFVEHNPSCNVMYRTEVFRAVGGFEEGLWPGEDVELDHRLRKKGLRLACVPDAVVCHFRPDTFRKFSRMLYRYGWSSGYLVRKYGFFRKVQLFSFSLILVPLAAAAMLVWPWTAYAAVAVLFLFFLYFRDPRLLGMAFIGIWHWDKGFLQGFLRNPKVKL